MTLRFSRLFSFALDCHLELTFQYDRICQLKALPRRVQNVFWQDWDSNACTHLCTRILDERISWVWRLRPLGHPAWLASIFLYDVCFFNWVIFSIQRYNLRSGLCHPFEKIFVEAHVYFRVSHVFAGYLLSFLCIFKPLGYQPPNDVAIQSFVFFCFGLSSWIDVPIWQNLSAEGSASSCSKRFLTGLGFERMHTLVYQNSRRTSFLSLAP